MDQRWTLWTGPNTVLHIIRSDWVPTPPKDPNGFHGSHGSHVSRGSHGSHGSHSPTIFTGLTDPTGLAEQIGFQRVQTGYNEFNGSHGSHGSDLTGLLGSWGRFVVRLGSVQGRFREVLGAARVKNGERQTYIIF